MALQYTPPADTEAVWMPNNKLAEHVKSIGLKLSNN